MKRKVGGVSYPCCTPFKWGIFLILGALKCAQNEHFLLLCIKNTQKRTIKLN